MHFFLSLAVLDALREQLQAPEYVHVLLNPLPVYGLAMGVLALLVGLMIRSRPARITALVVVCVSAASAWPVYHYGEEGYDRVKAMADESGELWLDEHVARAEKLIVAFYVVAALAATALFAPCKWPRMDLPLALLTLALAIGTLGIGGWIAFAGGHIRHKEFRDGPPPERAAHEHAH
jgi:hypothetical protein